MILSFASDGGQPDPHSFADTTSRARTRRSRPSRADAQPSAAIATQLNSMCAICRDSLCRDGVQEETAKIFANNLAAERQLSLDPDGADPQPRHRNLRDAAPKGSRPQQADPGKAQADGTMIPGSGSAYRSRASLARAMSWKSSVAPSAASFTIEAATSTWKSGTPGGAISDAKSSGVVMPRCVYLMRCTISSWFFRTCLQTRGPSTKRFGNFARHLLDRPDAGLDVLERRRIRRFCGDGVMSPPVDGPIRVSIPPTPSKRR